MISSFNVPVSIIEWDRMRSKIDRCSLPKLNLWKLKQPAWLCLYVTMKIRFLSNYAIRADSYRAENISPWTICRNDIQQTNSLSVKTVCSIALQVRSYVLFDFICACKRNLPFGWRCLRAFCQKGPHLS